MKVQDGSSTEVASMQSVGPALADAQGGQAMELQAGVPVERSDQLELLLLLREKCRLLELV
jgi:hypothetical protein